MTEKSVYFSFVSKKESCGIVLYNRKSGKEIRRIPFSLQEKIGNVFCKYVDDIDTEAVSYQFYEDDKVLPDEKAKGFAGKQIYGKAREEKDLKAIFLRDSFDWEGTMNPQIPYHQAVGYCMHVRGFTRHSSSGVAHRGTFLGVIEKIPYLKETGITTVELQPAYEFLELPTTQELKRELIGLATEEDIAALGLKKLNYWGYKKAYYYAPKAAYAAGEDAAEEFKTLVREFHKNNLEVVMQFYFPKDVKWQEIIDILHFWVKEYHVDGFHLMGENLPMSMVVADDFLADTKIWYYRFATDEIYEKDDYPIYCNLAEYNDDYLYTIRKYLKGDEGMLQELLYQMRYVPQKLGRIHYVTNYYGLTLMDMVSYDHKHNEANGESNKDGNDYNYSWNCGEEGATRKKKIMQLRKRQIKNAFSMLMLTNSTPLIFMGDEFGNTQQGNNNPYCQDNKVTWLNWKDLEQNQELYQFWKLLVNLRREHPILHPEKEFRIMDTLSCGYPDLSYHGQSAWKPQLEYYNRQIGLMYCGKYAKRDTTKEDDFFYITMNMHWEPHAMAMPRLPKGYKWRLLYTTGEELEEINHIAARSISVFQSVEEEQVSVSKIQRHRKINE